MRRKEKLDDRDVDNILMGIVNRQRFTYTPKLIIEYILKCVCFRRKNKLRKIQKLRPHLYFDKAEDKL